MRRAVTIPGSRGTRALEGKKGVTGLYYSNEKVIEHLILDLTWAMSDTDPVCRKGRIIKRPKYEYEYDLCAALSCGLYGTVPSHPCQ
jgi:hypothetical protein